MGDIRGVDFRLVISQSNGLLINVDRRPYRLKTKAYNHDYSAESIPDRREPYRRVPLGRVYLDERRLDEVQ